MESALVSLFSVALLIITTITMMITSMQSAANISDAWQNINTQMEETLQTAIDVNQATPYHGGAIELKVLNIGQKVLTSFDKWDTIVEYADGSTVYITYKESGTLGNNEWTTAGIFMTNSGLEEIFDPGILNPEEELIILINTYPQISLGETVRVTVSTPGGITSQCLVTYVENG
jgi:hypothetical protein